MTKEFWRFKYSLLPGIFISFSLFFALIFIYFTLFDASVKESISNPLTPRVISLLKFTLFQAFLSTLLSVFIGILVAWALHHQKDFLGRDLIIALFSSSLVLPTLVVVMGLITILGRNGWINQTLEYFFHNNLGGFIYGLTGILIAHTYLNASYSIRSFLHKFQSIPIERYKLSKSLGLSTFQKFILIELPSLKESILPVSSTIFLLCFTSFAIVLTLGGNPSYNTLEVAIYEAVRVDFDIAMALKLALVQLFISLFLVLVSSSLSHSISNINTQNNKIPWNEKTKISLFQKTIIISAALFFILPLLATVIDGLNQNLLHVIQSDIFKKSFKTSIYIATISSFFSLFLAIFLSYAKRDLDFRLKNYKTSKILSFVISFVSTLYLAIPSLILGLAVFLIARNSGFSLNSWAFFALIGANILLSLPFSIFTIYPMIKKISTRYDKLSFSLGLKPHQRWIWIDYPFLKESIGYTLALSFCFSLGDLGVIALFGNENFTTLPWYLYGLMGSYRTGEASSVALVLLIIISSVFIIIPKIFKGPKIVKN